MAEFRKATVGLPRPPQEYDPRDQAELRRLVEHALLQQGPDTKALVCQAKITATTATQVTVRVGVADPEPQGADSASIAHVYTISTGAGTVDKSSPQTCTPEATLTYAAGTYVDYVVDRPAINTGSGRIVFTVTANGRMQASDAVDIPALDIVYVLCKAKVTASDDLTVTITVTADAVGGTPTVGYVGVTGATLNSGHASGTYTYAQNSTDNVWVFNRPAAGAGMGQAQFRAVLTGAQSDDDFVTIIEQVPTAGIVQCSANITAMDADTVTVTVEGSATSGTVTVGLVGVTGSATLNSGHAAGTYTYAINGTDNVWVFDRGDIGSDLGFAQFRAIYDGGPETDDDTATVNEKGRDTAPLMCRARQIAMDATTVTVRVTVADAYPQGTDSATITYYEYNVGAATTPSSGQLVTPSSDLNPFAFLVAEDDTQRLAEDGTVRSNEDFSESPPTFVDFVITRPPFGTGAGRVAFTASATGRTQDSDSVDIPEVNRDTVYLAMRARVTDTDEETVTVRVAVADPICATDPQNATITYQSYGVTSVTPSSGVTVTPAATLTEAAGTYQDFVITRADAGSGTGRVVFTATATGRVTDADAVDVPAQEITGLLITLTQTASTGFSDPGEGVLPTVTLTMVVSDPRNVLTGNATVTITTNGVSSLYNETLGAPAVTFNATIGATYTFTVTLYKALAGGGFVRFAASKTGGYEGHATFWCSNAWAEANADCIITIGNNESESDITAKASLVVNTVTNADSMKWLASTSIQPTKAATIATGTSVTLGPPFYVSDLGVSLALGDTVYVTVVLYDYAGQLIDKSFEVKATRTSLSRSKTVQWAAAGWFHPYIHPSYFLYGDAFISWAIERTSDELFVTCDSGLTLSAPHFGSSVAAMSFTISDDCRVKSFSGEFWGEEDATYGPDDYCSPALTLFAVPFGESTDTASPLGSVSSNVTGGWETATPVLIDELTTGKRFTATVNFYGVRQHGSDYFMGKFRSFSVTYLPSNTQATV